jgi:hypothetical protein
MKRAVSFVALGLLLSAGSCGDTSNTGAGGSGGTAGGGGSGGGAGGVGGTGGVGGKDPCDGFETLDETRARWKRRWEIDDGATHPACPNGTILELETAGAVPIETPPDLNPIYCPGDEFFVIKPQKMKDCALDSYCPTPTSAYGFYVHRYRRPTSVNLGPQETLYSYVDGAWQLDHDRKIYLSPDDSKQLVYFDLKYRPSTNPDPGTCITE